MIVEDDEWSMKLVKVVLEVRGYSMIESWSGEKAYRIACLEPPDLILMDICLPGMSGLDVIKIFKEDKDLKRIPIIAVTALAMPGDEQRMRRGGADAYIAKPFSITELTIAIDELLKGNFFKS
jgi:two-component system cell cycle response regulator DivK